MEIQLWKEILSPYEQAVDELLVKFNHIIMQYKSMGMYSPIESVTGRVKTVSSIIDKLQKKHNISEHNSKISCRLPAPCRHSHYDGLRKRNSRNAHYIIFKYHPCCLSPALPA